MTQPLSARAEAGEDARKLLPELCGRQLGGGDDWNTVALPDDFWALLDVGTPEAHLAAAMMLVPENDKECWALGYGIDGQAFATIAFERSAYAPTPFHALIAAIAHQQETDNGD